MLPTLWYLKYCFLFSRRQIVFDIMKPYSGRRCSVYDCILFEMNITIKCRKCRTELISHPEKTILNIHGNILNIYDKMCVRNSACKSDVKNDVFYIDETEMPEWIINIINEVSFCRVQISQVYVFVTFFKVSTVSVQLSPKKEHVFAFQYLGYTKWVLNNYSQKNRSDKKNKTDPTQYKCTS